MNIPRLSLFETVFVSGILAIVIAILLTALDPLDKLNRSNDAKVQRDIFQLAQAIDRYFVTHEGYPSGVDIQQVLIDARELQVRLTPPEDYTCDKIAKRYIISIDRNVKVSCRLYSKKFLNAGQTHWVWCSDSGKAGPTTGSCPE